MTKINNRTMEVQKLRYILQQVTDLLDFIDPLCEHAVDLDLYNPIEMRINGALVTASDELITAKLYLTSRINELTKD